MFFSEFCPNSLPDGVSYILGMSDITCRHTIITRENSSFAIFSSSTLRLDYQTFHKLSLNFELNHRVSIFDGITRMTAKVFSLLGVEPLAYQQME